MGDISVVTRVPDLLLIKAYWVELVLRRHRAGAEVHRGQIYSRGHAGGLSLGNLGPVVLVLMVIHDQRLLLHRHLEFPHIQEGAANICSIVGVHILHLKENT